MKKKLIILTVVLIILFLGISAGKINEKTNENNKISKEVYEELEKEGKATVILKISEDYRLSNGKNIDLQSLEKNAILNNIKDEGINDDDEFVITSLTRDEIDEIISSEGIESISYSYPIRAFLQDSVNVVNASFIWPSQQNYTNITGIDETICIIDTGADFSHPALLGKNKTCVVNCYNQACAEDCSIGDDNGHGTHVAGIVAASSSINGIAPGANIISLKILDSNGDGHSTSSTDDLKNAVNWCIANRLTYNISVISMSLGTGSLFNNYCDSNPSFTLWTNAINNATAYNISVVAATGNSGSGVPRNTTHIASPACIQNATSVSATDKDDSVASYGHFNNLTDFFAPGTSINSSVPTGSCTNCDSSMYKVLQGTSMATPHVAAAFALVREFYRLQTGEVYTPAQIQTALQNKGKNITTSTGINISRINIYDSILSLDVSSPSISLLIPSNNTQSAQANQTFRCNANDLLVKNSTFYLWNSSGSVYNQTNQIITGTNVSSYFNISNIALGNYTWNCRFTDEGNNFATSSSSNYSLSVVNITASLVTPSNNNFTNSAQNNYTCESVTHQNFSLSNITFYLWNSSNALIYNITNSSVTGNVNTTAFSYAFTSESNYLWNCLARNNISDSAEATENYSITYDTSKPNVTSVSPADGYGETASSTTITFTYNFTDNINMSTCNLILNNAVDQTNSTARNQTTNHAFTKSVNAGSYTWNINCQDNAGNVGNSTNRTFTITAPSGGSSGGSSGGGSSGGSSGGGSGGGGGGGISSSAQQTYSIDNVQIASGYTKELKKNDKVEFLLFDANSEKHTLSVDEVNNNSVKITIRSEPLTLVLGIGQSAKLNLTSGEFYDLLVKLDSIENSKAKLTIQSIRDPILIEIKTKEIDGESGRIINIIKGIPFKIVIGIIIGILLIGAIIFYGFEKYEKKKIKKEVIRNLKKKK